MTVGSVSRSQSVHTTTAAAPPPPPSDAAPIDMSRDVADTTPSRTSRGERTQAAVAIVPPRAAVDPRIHHAAEAFARDGLPGLDRFLADHPQEARYLLSVSRDHLAAEIRADLGARANYQGAFGSIRAYTDAESIDAHLVATFQPRIRESVRDVVTARIDAMTHALESMPIDQAVAALRDAPPGSPNAALREALHMPGNSMDHERVESWVRTSLHELHALRDTVMGQTWMPEEFPRSMAQVQRTMGLERATEHSIAGEALFRGHSGLAELAHAWETGIDTIMVGYEVAEVTVEALHATHLASEAAELAHAGMLVESAEMSSLAALATESAIASTGGVAVGLGGLAFGYMLHHQIQENRAERTETARQLGL